LIATPVIRLFFWAEDLLLYEILSLVLEKPKLNNLVKLVALDFINYYVIFLFNEEVGVI